MEHIESVQHQSNEAAYGMAAKQGGDSAVPKADSTESNRIRGRGSTKRRFAQIEDDDDGNDSDEHSRNAPKVSRFGTDKVWVVGTEDMLAVQDAARGRENLGLDLGLDVKNISIVWKCLAGLRMKDVPALLEKMATEHNEEPSCIVLHVGRNDLEPLSRSDFLGIGKHMINSIVKEFRYAKLVWSELLPNARGMNPTRVAMDDALAVTILEAGGCYMHYPGLEIVDRRVFTESEKGDMNLTAEGCLKIMHVMKGGIVSIVRRNISIVPILQGVPNSVSMFVKKNLGGKFFVRKRRKKFPFARR